jgi:hypothetical protein
MTLTGAPFTTIVYGYLIYARWGPAVTASRQPV